MRAQPSGNGSQGSASPTTRHLFDHLSEAASLVNAARRVFLFLDFDGTLAPIVDEPGDATMSAEARALLIVLMRKPRFSVAIVSGRALADLETRVGLERLTYAGDHGFEIRGPGLSFIEPTAVKRMSALNRVAGDLENRLREIAGVRVENKGLTASVHYRKVREEQRDQVREIVKDTVATAGGLFRVTQGLSVLEIRPRVNWHKGTAARWIMMASGYRDGMPVYLGDDATDEDAFVSLASGITVRVGRTTETSAKYHLEYQESTAEFLAWLAELEAPAAPQTLSVVPGSLLK